jgi:hypothetical protein
MTKDYNVNKKLMCKIELKHKRGSKKSLCFGVEALAKIKLKYYGNQIVDSFE